MSNEMSNAKRHVERALGIERVYARTIRKAQNLKVKVTGREIFTMNGDEHVTLGVGATWMEAADCALANGKKDEAKKYVKAWLDNCNPLVELIENGKVIESQNFVSRRAAINYAKHIAEREGCEWGAN